MFPACVYLCCSFCAPLTVQHHLSDCICPYRAPELQLRVTCLHLSRKSDLYCPLSSLAQCPRGNCLWICSQFRKAENKRHTKQTPHSKQSNVTLMVQSVWLPEVSWSTDWEYKGGGSPTPPHLKRNTIAGALKFLKTSADKYVCVVAVRLGASLRHVH